MIRTLLFALLLPVPAFAQTAPQDIYERIRQRVGSDPALAQALGKPAPEMAQIAWVAGTWDVETIVDVRPDASEHGTSVVTPLFGGVWLEVRDTYPRGTQDVTYIGFDPAMRRWRSVSVDNVGTANVSTAEGWKDNKLTFEGDYLILGMPAHLRQIVTHVSDDEYRVDNEERVGDQWKHLDGYHYVRKRQP